ncbi:hypothetical protein CYMTET_19242 [Cymbomonas tetramitiformis]|uniref:Uncharacterized protein n=1 Tax=Cymbomonas tetramitiformis TaxID=36881 RepID=A0AAE0G6J2_9CHLO|nr:hypothetical protein CYMTET_19242 [Cymbomonas tetramitiformis]
MLHYLAIPHKPRSFSTANYLFRWFNFQVSFPMDVQLDEFCGDQEEEETSFAEPFIHESVPEKALHMAVNTGTAVLSVAALLALLSFVMWANGWTAPASLTFPRSHILLLQFSVSGLFQGCGFALAHATWQGMVLAFAIIGSVCFYMWRVVIALHRGLLEEHLYLLQPAPPDMGGHRWVRTNDASKQTVAQNFALAYEPFFGHLADVRKRSRLHRRVLVAYNPMRVLKKGLVALQLGVWVRCVPHCDEGARLHCTALQLAGLLAVTGMDVFVVFWFKPFATAFRHNVVMAIATCELLTFVSAALLAIDVPGAVFLVYIFQAVSAAVQMVWMAHNLHNRYQRWKRHVVRQRRNAEGGGRMVDGIFSTLIGLLDPSLNDRRVSFKGPPPPPPPPPQSQKQQAAALRNLEWLTKRKVYGDAETLTQQNPLFARKSIVGGFVGVRHLPPREAEPPLERDGASFAVPATDEDAEPHSHTLGFFFGDFFGRKSICPPEEEGSNEDKEERAESIHIQGAKVTFNPLNSRAR